MNKKRILVFVLLMVLVLASASVVLAVSNPNSRKTLDWNNEPWMNFDEVLSKQGSQTDTQKKMVVPVYYETDLLFETNGMYYLNRDASFHYGLSSLPNDASAILAAYPTTALRVRSDQSSYAVYDTDQGNRFFLFFNYNGKISTTIGFPIVINKLLSYSDFKDIAVGDTIDAVAAIDDVAELYKKTFFEVWQLDYVGAKSLSEIGHPCVTVHYLKDGILKIEYEMLEDQSLVVSNIVFSKDFQIRSANGKVINYKIEDIDLPTN